MLGTRKVFRSGMLDASLLETGPENELFMVDKPATLLLNAFHHT